jgi:hypothetical protein
MSQPLASFQISSSIQDRLIPIFHSIPKILVFLLILVIGCFVATASIVIVTLGVIAALNQVGIAAAVTRPILYTVLLTCGAIIAIGVGGGLIKPMQARWERMLKAAERDEQGNGEPARGPGLSRGPGHLQSFGYSRSFGYSLGGYASLGDPGHQEDPGRAPGTDVLDDSEYYPGGQYM